MKLEMKKALQGRGFGLALLIGLVIVAVQSVTINQYLKVYFIDVSVTDKIYANTAEVSFLQAWIGQDPITAFGFLYYLVLFPLLACLPWAASHFQEQELGYDKVSIVLLGKNRYLRNKYIVTFLTGGIVITIPPLISVMIAMSYLPIIPETLAMAQTAVYAGTLWGVLFYERPLLYVCLWLMLDFVVGGCLAVCGLALTFIVESKFQLLVLPMMLNMLLVELCNFAPGFLGLVCKLIPYCYVAPVGISQVRGSTVLISIVLMLVGSAIIYFGMGKRRDIV